MSKVPDKKTLEDKDWNMRRASLENDVIAACHGLIAHTGSGAFMFPLDESNLKVVIVCGPLDRFGTWSQTTERKTSTASAFSKRAAEVLDAIGQPSQLGFFFAHLLLYPFFADFFPRRFKIRIYELCLDMERQKFWLRGRRRPLDS
jgi:hypothetical protein